MQRLLYFKQNTFTYTKTRWTFLKDDLCFRLTIHKQFCRLRLKRGNETLYDSGRVPSMNWFEAGFLEAIGETTPLNLLRIGPQTPRVQKWLDKKRQAKAERDAQIRKVNRAKEKARKAKPIKVRGK